ncbi:casein kinase II subunit alpha [Nematocida sp. AWRm80]|nr:casein kinase II subunit alpha [Nematocida sp. AWRm80]
MVSTTSRVYSDSSISRGSSYYNYINYTIDYGDIDNYRIEEYIGKGKYSQVFKGIDSKGERCVIKVLKPIREKKINRELKILNTLRGVKNIIEIKDIVRDSDSGGRALIFPYEDHLDTREIFKDITLEEIKYYCKEILSTLDKIHSYGIMHRDIKPHNLIVNRGKGIIRIIDWGLAEYYLPNMEYAIRVASLHFKAPELLLDHSTYDYAIDLWAFGCVLCEMVLKRMPMFNGKSNDNQLIKIIEVLGMNGLVEYAKKYQLKPPVTLMHHKNTLPREPKWEMIRKESIAKMNFSEEQSQEFISFLKGFLTYDHQERITAADALRHPFLKD